MPQHLSPEQIELLSQHKVKGRERVKILLHLEVCASCRSRIRRPSKAEIMERLLPDEEEKDERHRQANNPGPLRCPCL